ncbi:putative T7SS-secreted protein [Nocardia alni]|uniref:putative T7SS-secreted protein n=1 Tax=Nocardia alni TaxID=2815723 RepID=UPI001C21F646|nr:RHS repeat-associated core domain-containing protein [Nocardia alni]
MGWLDDAANAVEHAADSVTEKAGALVDDGAKAASAVARDLGANGVATDIENFGDKVVDATGGQVAEKELGQTDDPKELIYGDTGKIAHTGDEIKKMGASIEKTGDALKKIDVAQWTGATADAFHDQFGKQPKLWWQGADAMNAASGVLDAWYHEVTAAQAKAADAIAKWKQAEAEERNKKTAWNALSEQQKRRTPLVDTWTSMGEAAQDILRGARSQRDNAAATAASGLSAATESAPAEPSFAARMVADVTDANSALEQAKGSFTKGLVGSVTSMVQFVRQVSPTDPYNQTHPAAYLKGMADLGTGLVVADADPGATVHAVLSGARKNPAEFAGALTGNLVTTLATGGAGAAKPALSAVKDVSEISQATKLADVAEDASKAATELPHTTPKLDLPHPADTAPAPHEPGPAPSSPGSDAGSPHPSDSTAPQQHSTTPSSEHTPSSADTGPTHSPDPAAPGSHTVDSGTQSHGPDAPTTGPGSHTEPTGPHPDTNAGPHPVQPADPGPAHPGDTAHPDPSGPQPHPADPPPGPHPDLGAHPDTHPDSAAPHDHSPHPDATSAGPADHSPDSTHPGQDHHDLDHTPDHHPSPDERADADHGTHHDATDAGPEHDRTEHQKVCSDDPVDIATGEFLLPETDIDLPGVLGLVLRRTHRSNYQRGRWFGPSWSATLDMRLVAEHEGVTFLGEDGLMLAYPHAPVGVGVEPVTGGQRWTLTRTETGSYQIWDQQRELIWHFAPEPVLGGIESRLGNYAISAITDRHRNRIRFTYTPDGAPLEVTHSGGYRVLIDTRAGRVTGLSVIDRGTAVPVKQFGYQAGELTSVANGVGATTVYTYTEGRMVSWTDSNGNQMVNTYDPAGRVVFQRGTNGVLDTDFDYFEFPDGTGSLTTVTDTSGATTRHGFDRDLRQRDLIDPVGAHTHIDYNADRRPLQVTTPDGAITRYQYTGTGDIAKIIRPDGNSTSIEYLFRNRPTTITDPDGSVRRQEWNKNGDLVAVVDAGGARTEYGYHPNGAVAHTLTLGGARTSIEVDAAGLPIVLTDPLGAVTRIERDGLGRPVVVTDPLGQVTRFDWAATGKLMRRTDPDGHAESWEYDGEGNLLTHVNRAGGVTRFTYGAFDLMASRTEPDSSTTHYLWDAQRRLSGVVNPLGQRWSYEYDPAGRVIAETDYTGATTRYTHDPTGRVATLTPATGISRRHRYDLLGRLTETNTDTGEFVRFTHDMTGRVLTALSGIGEETTHTLAFTYTPAGQLASQQLDDQPPTRHTYDPRGHRIARTTPTGGNTSWHYDTADRVLGLQTEGQHLSFTYDPLGRATGWRVGEIDIRTHLTGTGQVHTQDITAFPGTSLSLNLGPSSRPAPRTIRHDEYQYRPDGYLATHTVARPHSTPTRQDYDLDPIGRVTSILRDGALSEAYAYDPLGNITNALPATSAHAAPSPQGTEPDSDGQGEDYREYHNNLLIRSGRTHYYYDPAGRLIRKVTTRPSREPDVWHYRYNAFDQLTDIFTPERQWWRYTYDALGRRTSKQHLASDGTILERLDFTWDGTRLIEQTVGKTTTRWHYHPDSYRPITQSTNRESADREFYAIITDLAGAPTDLIDPNTAETSSATTSLWGQAVWNADQVSTPIRFAGQYHDQESGLHYNLHRTYDPASGRFLTQDPLGLSPAPNPFAYPHNPVSWADPLGLMPEACGSTDPRAVRFTQDSVSSQFRNQGSVFDLADALRSGDVAPSEIPPIRVFEKNGDLYTLDNRRLLAFQMADVHVPYTMATPQEIARDAFKMTSKTDGQSIRIRGAGGTTWPS